MGMGDDRKRRFVAVLIVAAMVVAAGATVLALVLA
jgi:hypothetical protein